MEVSTAEAWEQARAVFQLGSLELNAEELVQARRAARPFVQLVARRFLDGLDDNVLLRSELTNEITVLVRGWVDEMHLRYPRSAPRKGRRPRHRFDSFEMKLPTGERRLMLKFSLGVGLKPDNSWRLIDWWLGTWGGRERVESQSMPVIHQIHRQLPDLQVESWRGTIGPSGTWAHVGRVVDYIEFGTEIDRSVSAVASDLGRLLEAAQPYQTS